MRHRLKPALQFVASIVVSVNDNNDPAVVTKPRIVSPSPGVAVEAL
jgi:hypothetical protein